MNISHKIISCCVHFNKNLALLSNLDKNIDSSIYEKMLPELGLFVLLQTRQSSS